MMEPRELSTLIKQRARELGFTACGITRATAVSDDIRRQFDEWIASGANGGMNYMAGNYEKAYEYASLCFNDEYYLTYETIYFYAMLSEQLGMKGGYQAAVDLLATNKETLSPTVDKYLNGEITAEQLFKNGEVVFE